MSFGDLTAQVHAQIQSTFGETIVYEPLSGGSFSIEGVFNDRYTGVDPATEQLVTSVQPTLGVKLSDLAAPPAKGDFVTIRNVKYRIREIQEDGEGWINLFLFKK